MKYILFALIVCSLNVTGQQFTRVVKTKCNCLMDYAVTLEARNPDYTLSVTPCSHIYVAVLPDTLVWDKSYSGGWSGGSTYPEPTTQKIVCILCHKITEQQIKIINESHK